MVNLARYTIQTKSELSRDEAVILTADKPMALRHVNCLRL